MSYREVMSLPIRTFWFMSECINRIRAELDMRSLSVSAAVNSSEGMKEKFDELSRDLGKVTQFEELFDASGMELLLASL